jgi:hypothetical protein
LNLKTRINRLEVEHSVLFGLDFDRMSLDELRNLVHETTKVKLREKLQREPMEREVLEACEKDIANLGTLSLEQLRSIRAKLEY